VGGRVAAPRDRGALSDGTIPAPVFTSRIAAPTLRAVAISEQQLAADLTAAMKARDALRTSVLRGVLAAAKNLKVEKRVAALADPDLVQLVRKEVKKREEAESFAVQAGRDDLVTQNRAEREVLETYVPVPVDAATLETAVRELAAQPGATLGGIMGALKARWAGRYDGKLASELARRALAATPPAG